MFFSHSGAIRIYLLVECGPTSNTRMINGEIKGIHISLIMAIYNIFLVIQYNIMDMLHFLETIVWIKDSDMSIKGYP
jgi:hypothetical protein